MKPQYLVYDHNRFSAKMLVKFHYFSKKLSKTGKRTAWQLHGTCTPLIPMSSRVIRVYHYANVRVMAAAVSTLPLRFADTVSLAPRRGAWRISPQRHTMLMYFCGMARSGGRSARPCFPASSGKGYLSLCHLKGWDFCYQLGFQSAA